MDDIEQRLRDAHSGSQQYAAGSMILLEAADEIASLRHQLEQSETVKFRYMGLLRAAESKRKGGKRS
ncbi:MAG: hypothetical protein R3180_00025 [Marinobacter sp.]|nr:hypothetical protein [Marinobacter sp.]